MLTKGELRALLDAWCVLAVLLSSKSLSDDAERDLTVAVRALERAYSKAAAPS